MLRQNRTLAKFKFFLTCLQDTQGEQPQNTPVSQLILMLVSSELSPEEFYTRIQSITNNSLEEFHLDLINAGLPMLRDELNSLVSQSCNGQPSSSPLHQSTSSQEYSYISNNLSDGDIDPITPDIQHVKRATSLTSTLSGFEELDYSIIHKTGQVSLKRNSSSSQLDSDNMVYLSPDRLHKIVRLASKIVPLLQEFTELSNDSLSMGANIRDPSDTDSNDSSSLHIADYDCNEYGHQDRRINGLDTHQENQLPLCANCNRSSVISCVCRVIAYCSAFCRDKHRDVHQSECYDTTPSSMQPITIPQAIYIDRPQQPNIIQNGNHTPMNTSSTLSSNIPTPIYLQIPITSSSVTTPICSISQP